MRLSPYRTLQNVIQTQKCEPCQLNKLTSPPFLQEAFHLTQPHPDDPKGQTRAQFNHHVMNSNR